MAAMKACTWILATTAVLALATSCSTFYRDEEGRAYPKRPNYSLKGELSLENNPVDTSCLYVFAWSDVEEGVYYHWLRFWEDGHVLHKSVRADRQPTQDDGNSFSGCDMGYYVVSSNKVFVETFAPVDWGRYGMMQLALVGDDLVLRQSGLRGSRPRHAARMYKKTFVGDLTSTPDW